MSVHANRDHRSIEKSSSKSSSSAGTQSQIEQRRYVRHPANWPATIYQQNKFICETTVIDASYAGLGLAFQLPGEVNEIYTIALSSIGTFSCRVAWRGDGRSGVELLPENGGLTDDQLGEVALVLC